MDFAGKLDSELIIPGRLELGLRSSANEGSETAGLLGIFG